MKSPRTADPDPPAGESDAVKRIVPWVVSAGLHAGLIALGFLLTWTVVTLDDGRDPILVKAEFDALTYDPLASLEAEAEPAEETPAPPRLPVEPLETQLAEELARLDTPVVSLELSGPPLTDVAFAPAPSLDSASFVGLETTNAREIVYVIDASGSMIGALPVVIAELARSLSALSPRQSFGIVFFQDNEAVTVPPANRLQPATAETRRQALRWIDERVIPGGRSNPLAALEKALSFRPDVIFLLSEDITGSGRFEIDQEDLLALLDQLNPVDAGTGRRAVQINCVQFLDPDPLETLSRIAARHGGPDGYRFLGREELGLGEP